MQPLASDPQAVRPQETPHRSVRAAERWRLVLCASRRDAWLAGCCIREDAPALVSCAAKTAPRRRTRHLPGPEEAGVQRSRGLTGPLESWRRTARPSYASLEQRRPTVAVGSGGLRPATLTPRTPKPANLLIDDLVYHQQTRRSLVQWFFYAECTLSERQACVLHQLWLEPLPSR